MTDLEKELKGLDFKFERQSDDPLVIFGGTALNEGPIRTYSNGFSIKEVANGWVLKLPDGQGRIETWHNSMAEVLENLKKHFSDESYRK